MTTKRPDPNPVPVQKMAYWAQWTWLILLTAGAALEMYGLASPDRGDTLTETTRWIWHTNTPVGAWSFRIFWVAFAIWFGPHIVKLARQHRSNRR